MSRNGHRAWRLRVKLPHDFGEPELTAEVFAWIRDHLMPALLEAPVPIDLHFEPPPPTEDSVGLEEPHD